MERYFERALRNINAHGDTDIFPFPMENHVFFDCRADVIDLLKQMNADPNRYLTNDPPANANALAPVSYTGFRWATQIDPIWNAFFLGNVLSITEHIEAVRIPASENVVFSYRNKWDEISDDCFDTEFNWSSFMRRSLEKCEDHKFVLTCDISEFYARINHHRLDNALGQLRTGTSAPSHIMKFLKNFSSTYSFGMPVGGPAARILSELLLNQIDKLLSMHGFDFCRFADDYHIFADSYEHALAALIFLSEKLLQNQGLQLQKSKTRIMTVSEFVATSPMKPIVEVDGEEPEDADLATRARKLLQFSIRFDPYATNSNQRYEALKQEIKRINIIELLKSELSKSRVHISLTRRIVSALRFIEDEYRDDAIISLVDNHDLLFPIFSSVLIVVKQLFSQLAVETQDYVISKVQQLLRSGSHVLSVELNKAYAVRVLSCKENTISAEILNEMYHQSKNSIIRRDIIILMARWKSWYWLSDLKNTFRYLSPLERRAFIASSFLLDDEGGHWRSHTRREFNQIEAIVEGWAKNKFAVPGWELPL